MRYLCMLLRLEPQVMRSLSLARNEVVFEKSASQKVGNELIKVEKQN